MQPGVSLLRLRGPATCPYPESDQFNPWFSTQILEDPFNTNLQSIQVFLVASFPQISPSKPCMNPFCPPHTPHAPPLPIFFISLPEVQFVRSTDLKASRYVVFSTQKE
jgi:hypothetical protein